MGMLGEMSKIMDLKKQIESGGLKLPVILSIEKKAGNLIITLQASIPLEKPSLSPEEKNT